MLDQIVEQVRGLYSKPGKFVTLIEVHPDTLSTFQAIFDRSPNLVSGVQIKTNPVLPVGMVKLSYVELVWLGTHQDP